MAEQIAHAPVPDPRARVPGLDPALSQLAMCMMGKLPEERPQTPVEVVQRLSEWLGKTSLSISAGSLTRLPDLVTPGDSQAAQPVATTPKIESLFVTQPAIPRRDPFKIAATVAVVLLLALVAWRLPGQPIGGAAAYPGGGHPGYGPPPGMPFTPPPPPWWREEWGPCPPIEPGMHYGPPPEWARVPGGRPPQGWNPKAYQGLGPGHFRPPPPGPQSTQ